MDIVKAFLLPVAAWLLMTGHARYRQLSPDKRRVFATAVISLAVIGMVRLAIHAFSYTLHPPLWDFVNFWIVGVTASHGLNYYDPALATQVAAPFHVDTGFAREALATPFLYPPPTIVWFVPLGWLDVHTAAGAWYAAHLAFLAGSIIVLSLTFFETLSAVDVAFTAALVLMLRGTDWNVDHGQTVFLALLFISLAFRHRDNIWGGVWLALAILVKPFLTVVMLYAVLQRKWRPLAGAAVTLLAATVMIFITFGRTVFAGYAAIRFDALPREMYTEIENQSLLAGILRVTDSHAHFPPAYVIIAALCAAILVWRLSTVQKQNEAAGFALALTFGLLFYPSSLHSYTVLLIFPILVLYRARLWIPMLLAYSVMFLWQGDYLVLGTLAIGIALAVRMPATPFETERLPEPCLPAGSF